MIPPNVQAAKYCGEKSSIFPFFGITEESFVFSPDEAIVALSVQYGKIECLDSGATVRIEWAGERDRRLARIRGRQRWKEDQLNKTYSN